MVWSRLSKKYPQVFSESTKPVWFTLFPLIAGGCLWAGYIGCRTLFGHNEIVLSNKAEEPYLLRESPKLFSRERNIATKMNYSRMMDGQQA
jgi:hypothetical protein